MRFAIQTPKVTGGETAKFDGGTRAVVAPQCHGGCGNALAYPIGVGLFIASTDNHACRDCVAASDPVLVAAFDQVTA